MRKAISGAGRVLAVVLLLLTGMIGVRNGIREYPEAATGGQRFATATEAGYGLASWAALYGLLARRDWSRPVLILWAALVTITAAAATVAWGGAGLGAAAAGGASAGAVCALVIWLAGLPQKPRRNAPGQAE